MAFNPLDAKSWKHLYDRIVGGYKDITGVKVAEDSLESNEKLAREQMQLLEEQNKESNAIARENIAWQKDIANMNFGLQQSQFDYQKRLNQLQMEREDNAIQRQVADLQAAGFSPLMATGGASTSPLTSGSAPQFDVSGVSAAQSSYLQLAQQYAQLKQDSMNSHRSAKVQAMQNLSTTKQASSFALASLIRGVNQDLNAQYWNLQNYRLNAKHQDLQNQLIQEQIETSKASRNWNEENGWRNESLQNYLVTMLESFMPAKEAGNILRQILNKVENGELDNVNKMIDNIKNATPEVKTAAKEMVENISNSFNDSKTAFDQWQSVNKDSIFQRALVTGKKEKRAKYLEQFYENHSELFGKKMYKYQFANLSYKQLWQFYKNPKKFVEEW